MFRPARQCVSRWSFRLFFLVLLVLSATWVFFLHRSNGTGCSSSTECYALLMNKLRINSTRLASVRLSFNSSDTALSPLLSSPVSDVEAPHEPLTEKEIEYARLTNSSLPRVKGAFVVLVRNKELHALRASMRHLEDRFNHKYNYPWIFLNEEPFTDEFMDMTRQMTKAEAYYGLVPEDQWSYPSWINQTYAKECRDTMEQSGIPYGGSETYRHMCRYQSGFFFLHPLLDGYDYYWRVEPGVKFSCDIDYDPFRLMQERDLKYGTVTSNDIPPLTFRRCFLGFTIALVEYPLTVPTLWEATLDFAKQNPQYIYPMTNSDSLLRFISDDDGQSYNYCHFWSNFEIASLKFMRSEGYQAYFRHLDSLGGFFYERWGDAPVHSIAAALMLSSKEVHWFYDIGYRHDNFEHCPTEPNWLVHGKCYCDPGTSFDTNLGSCLPKYLAVTNTTQSDYIVLQPDREDL